MRRKIDLEVSEKDAEELINLANRVFEKELNSLGDECRYFLPTSKEGENYMFDQLIWWICDRYDVSSKRFYKVTEIEEGEEIPSGNPANPYLKRRRVGNTYCHVRRIELEIDVARVAQGKEIKNVVRRVFVNYLGSIIQSYEDSMNLNEDYMLLSYGEDNCFGQVFQRNNTNGTDGRRQEVEEISKDDFLEAFNKLIFNIKFEAVNEDDEDKTGNPYRCESK